MIAKYSHQLYPRVNLKSLLYYDMLWACG